MTNDCFIIRCELIHHGTYDYSHIPKSFKIKEKIPILCSKHGIFLQRADSHSSGSKCPKCCLTKSTSNISKFLYTAYKKHGDKYDYSKVEYSNSRSKVCIICSKHGEFWQTANNHLNGQGCKECGYISMKEKQRTNITEFIKNATLIHNNKYNYSKVNYINMTTKITIVCKHHGEFSQLPNDHLQGYGCPKCKSSKGENEIIKYLDANNIKYVHQKTFNDCRYTAKLPFDFYIPSKNLLIEYDGVQHFKPIKYFGGQKTYLKRIKYDILKNEYARINEIDLLRIPYWKFKDISNILSEI